MAAAAAAGGGGGGVGGAPLEGDASEDAAAVGDVHVLASRVAFCKARHESLQVERREFARAFAGVKGREPSGGEMQSEPHVSRLEAAVEGARHELSAAQAALARAQVVERRRLEESKKLAQEKRAELTRQKTALAAAQAQAAAQKEEDMKLLCELMAIGEKRIASTGSVLAPAARSSAVDAAAAAPSLRRARPPRPWRRRAGRRVARAEPAARDDGDAHVEARHDAGEAGRDGAGE